MKFRNLFAAAALGVVLAAPQANAQLPYTSPFWFQNIGPSNTSYDAYEGSFTSNSEGFFQIFCVNPNQNVSDPDAFNVWVTPFDATDGSHTEAGRGAPGASFNASYINAAKLSTLMIGNYPGGPLSPSQVTSLQQAIWWAMGFNEGTVGNYNTWMATYNSSGLKINTANWFVISDAARSDRKQEFIAYKDTPFETVPEPATMTLLATGLAGMAAARRRRKS